MSDRTKELLGIDAAPIIRAAQRQIAEATKMARRIAEVDAREGRPETSLTVDCMLFERPDGTWRLETIKEPWDGCGEVKIVDDERFLVSELKYELARRMLENRVCGLECARELAAKAVVMIHGRVAAK